LPILKHRILSEQTIDNGKDAMRTFMELYAKSIRGAISGWDRIRFRGTIRWLASETGINSYLSTRGILLKEFGAWAESITAKVRAICTAQADRLNIPVIYLNSAAIDKEACARRIMMERKVQTGDICMCSTVEPCHAALLKGNRSTGKLELKMAPRKCIWIYHYWNDENIGFGHTRLQTWLPLSVTICLNGRHWLERQFIRGDVDYVKDENCFTHISNYSKAQDLVNKQLQTDWPKLLNELQERNCPGLKAVMGGQPLDYYWSADETEWATDVVFNSSSHLDKLFQKLVRYGLLIAQSPAVMRFLGRSAKGRPPDEIASDLRSRYEGLRLKHWVNCNSIKIYNKAGNVLRTETTINQTRDFKVYRHPDDNTNRPASWQKMRKGVSDLHRRAKVSQASNERYLDQLAAASITDSLKETVGDICMRTFKDGKSFRAINPWNQEDFKTLQYLMHGENHINGFRNKHLLEILYVSAKDKTERKRLSAKISRRLRLLRMHGLIQKISRTNRYQLTAKGRKVATAVLAASAANTEQLMKLAA